MRNATDSNTQELGELEQQVMDLVWQYGPCHADAIREKLDRPLKDSTVRTVLRRLEEKGMVQHQVESRTYIYQATQARQHVAAKAVKKIMDWLCQGSVEELLVGLVDHSVVDRQELNRLATKIAKAKGEE
jgi:BlaI family transcriptional regulator, penicillinase repressor